MKKSNITTGAACFVLGAVLFGGGTAYAASGVLAERSAQAVYVDGQRVELDAYNIDGSNYVKLRDIGKAVNFNVYWDGTVQIQSGTPYTGESAAAQATTPPSMDESANATAAIFTGAYTREAYNALRQTIATGADSEAVAMSQATRDAMQEVTAAIGTWPGYDLKAAKGGAYYFSAKYPTAYQAAADYCRPFIDGLTGLSETEKARQIAFYVCDRLTYDATSTSTPRTALVDDNVHKGNCMSYAHNFMFLCNIANIPCVFVHSTTHQWNEVFVSGRWQSVDVSGVDIGDDADWRSDLPVLQPYMQGTDFVQSQPTLTVFAKELLIPGSTK